MVRYIPIQWEGEHGVAWLPQDVLMNAAISAAISGMESMAKEGQAHFQSLKSGDMKGPEFAGKILQKGAQKAAGSGSRVLAAYAVKQGMERVGKRLTGKLLLRGMNPFLRSNAMWSVAFGLVDQGVNTYQLATGGLNQRDYQVKSTQTAGATGGAVGGGIVGAMIGNVLLPGAGGLLGMLFGSMLGEKTGSAGGQLMGEKLFPKKETSEETSAPQS